jgi:hypothetical protein
MQEQMLETMQ